MNAQAILKKYWNHDSFRTPQESIIESVLNNKDTFALMPTGGGKSICFQVPALMKEGICLVISPLVALMKDQVQNLEKRGIKAIALTGGIKNDELIDLLDNCEFGNYKFLYLSPERLQTEWILDRIKNLKINLIAIDEAHCISQWGHDFRPAYLKISSLKNHFPNTPFLALTASATQMVQDDIVKQLTMSDCAIFKKSFKRANIAYMVFEVEDKLYRIEQILKKNKQPSIVYVRNRKSCIELSTQLQSLGFEATYYHGGLSTKEKNDNMNLWMSEKKQVIVATNAFGMGIDKANVKTVIHIQLPENIENYYQEAGRAGRNEEKAFAILLTNKSDIHTAEMQYISVLPNKEFLKIVFIKICNYFQIAYGEGFDETFSFNINDFCSQYNLPISKTYNALQFLDRQGTITLSQEFSEKITVQFIETSKEVIRYASAHPDEELVILTILRSYPGINNLKTSLNAFLIAKKSGETVSKVRDVLEKLHQKNIITLITNNNDTTIVLNEIREDERTINRIASQLETQNKLKKDQLEAVINYISENNTCKSNLILNYFGETETENCGICSFCIQQNIQNTVPIENLTETIVKYLKTQDLSSREIQIKTKSSDNDIIFALQFLLENEIIKIKSNNQYTLNT